MTVEQDLAAIRARRDRAQTAKMRADVQHEQAVEQLSAARSALETEFGLTTADSIRERLDTLRRDYDSLLAKAEEDLAAAGA